MSYNKKLLRCYRCGNIMSRHNGWVICLNRHCNCRKLRQSLYNTKK